MRSHGCIKVQLHAVVGAGEHTGRAVFKELLREQRNFNQRASAGVLSSELVVVLNRTDGLKQPVVDCRAISAN